MTPNGWLQIAILMALVVATARPLGLYMAESEKVVRRALDAGHSPRALLLSDRWVGPMADLVRDAKRHSSSAWYFRERQVYRTQLPSALGISRFTLDERLAFRFRERSTRVVRPASSC